MCKGARVEKGRRFCTRRRLKPRRTMRYTYAAFLAACKLKWRLQFGRQKWTLSLSKAVFPESPRRVPSSFANTRERAAVLAGSPKGGMFLRGGQGQQYGSSS